MSTGIAALGSALVSVPLVAALFCGSQESRMRMHAHAPGWLLRHGRRIAVMGLPVQIALSIGQIGPLAGPGTVLAGWMVAGSVFVAAINAWPRRTLRVGGAIGLAGLLLMLTSLLA